MEEKIKEFWKQKQVAFYHIFLDVMLLIYCISFYFAGNLLFFFIGGNLSFCRESGSNYPVCDSFCIRFVVYCDRIST